MNILMVNIVNCLQSRLILAGARRVGRLDKGCLDSAREIMSNRW